MAIRYLKATNLSGQIFAVFVVINFMHIKVCRFFG